MPLICVTCDRKARNPGSVAVGDESTDSVFEMERKSGYLQFDSGNQQAKAQNAMLQLESIISKFDSVNFVLISEQQLRTIFNDLDLLQQLSSPEYLRELNSTIQGKLDERVNSLVSELFVIASSKLHYNLDVGLTKLSQAELTNLENILVQIMKLSDQNSPIPEQFRLKRANILIQNYNNQFPQATIDATLKTDKKVEQIKHCLELLQTLKDFIGLNEDVGNLSKLSSRYQSLHCNVSPPLSKNSDDYKSILELFRYCLGLER